MYIDILRAPESKPLSKKGSYTRFTPSQIIFLQTASQDQYNSYSQIKVHLFKQCMTGCVFFQSYFGWGTIFSNKDCDVSLFFSIHASATMQIKANCIQG